MAMLVIYCLVAAYAVAVFGASNMEKMAEGIIETVEPNLAAVEMSCQSLLKQYGRIAMWKQQTELDEKRMQGDTGIMQVRNVRDGTKPWATNTWARRNGQAAIHNHANNIRTIGMGELAVSMNGVYFRTRHNDYRLNKAHSSDTTFGATEPVDFPDVPPSVLNMSTVEEQITEMKEYFVAFQTQNSRHRDYKPYFRPVLVYMEGIWLNDTGVISEIFHSDRHQINADTWFELQRDVMYETWTGKKDRGEDLATLPTMIYDVGDDGVPKMAQWNYRILAHPVSIDVPTSRFRLVEDLSPMLRLSKGRESILSSRLARFQMHPEYSDENFDGLWRTEGETSYMNFIDRLMNEVPGADNYPANISDFDEKGNIFDNANGDAQLNAGFYHRYYTQPSTDASGFQYGARGFADTNLYVAYNTQPEVAPIYERKNENDQEFSNERRASYAMPLEIVYMTPLLSWNPLNISFWDSNSIPQKNGRNGNTAERAYNGSSSKIYYRTPAALFADTDQNRDLADTAKDSVYVLDNKGDPHLVTPSGTKIFIPEIPPAGIIRTRYPIFGVHQDGSAIFKELSALTDITLDAPQHIHMYKNVLGGFTSSRFNGNEKFTFALRQATRSPHVHEFLLTANQIKAMREGDGYFSYPAYTIKVLTTTAANHEHVLVVGLVKGSPYLYIYYCDGLKDCRDGHANKADCLDCPSGMLD